jgi:hypothetical protein
MQKSTRGATSLKRLTRFHSQGTTARRRILHARCIVHMKMIAVLLSGANSYWKKLWRRSMFKALRRISHMTMRKARRKRKYIGRSLNIIAVGEEAKPASRKRKNKQDNHERMEASSHHTTNNPSRSIARETCLPRVITLRKTCCSGWSILVIGDSCMRFDGVKVDIM